MASLKRLYGLREMSVTVPDKDVPALRAVIGAAASTGHLPPEATGWVPAQGTPAAGVPQASGEPKKGKGKKAKQEPAAPASPQPVPVSPDTRAALDKSTSAWDSLAQQAPQVRPAAAKPTAAPVFDPTGAHPEYELPTFGDVPRSANVRLNKQGQPVADTGEPDMFAGAKKPGALSKIFGKKGSQAPEPAAMQPKRGALSRVFGKKQPKFQDNPYAVDQQPDWAAADGTDWGGSEGDPFVAAPRTATRKPEPLDPDAPPDAQPGEKTMGDLDTFLRQSPPSGKKAVAAMKRDVGANGPRPPTTVGQDAMSDLNWDLKRARGKR